MAYQAFQPPIRTLMGPGPSDVHPRVLAAMSKPTVGHLDPSFVTLMDDIKSLLQAIFQTRNGLTIAVSAPGSAGMEMCFVNLVQPGDTVVVCRNGVFGGRMAENVTRIGAKAVVVDDAWGSAVDIDKLGQTLKNHPETTTVAFVHAETSTGVRSDAEAITAVAHKYGCLVIMDAVTSLAGIPLMVDQWEVDAVYSGSQKCLSCAPGLSPVTLNENAVRRIQERKHPVQSWFLDLNLVMGYWGGEQKRSYHHTAPVNALYGLHEALLMVVEEGLENAWLRHQRMHAALREGLAAMNIEFVVDPDHRLPQLNAVRIPEGVDDAQVRSRLLQDYQLEIGAGLGGFAGKVWRIGLMGQSACTRNVVYCLSTLEKVLTDLKAPISQGVAVPAALSVLP